MFPLQAAWLYYLENPALVLNGLALFFAVTATSSMPARKCAASRMFGMR